MLLLRMTQGLSMEIWKGPSFYKLRKKSRNHVLPSKSGASTPRKQFEINERFSAGAAEIGTQRLFPQPLSTRVDEVSCLCAGFQPPRKALQGKRIFPAGCMRFVCSRRGIISLQSNKSYQSPAGSSRLLTPPLRHPVTWVGDAIARKRFRARPRVRFSARPAARLHRIGSGAGARGTACTLD